MRLEDIPWKRFNDYWDQAKLGVKDQIIVWRCVKAPPAYSAQAVVNSYWIDVGPMDDEYTDLDPITAQAIIFHLLGNSGGNDG